MRKVSTDFKNQIIDKRAFYYNVTFQFIDDPNQVIIGNSDLMTDGCLINISSESSSFPLGCAIGKTLTLSMPNLDDRWSEYNFFGCTIHVVLCNDIDATGNTERIDLGTYTVINPVALGSTIEITAVDDMFKADEAYAGGEANITIGDLLDKVCRSCGLEAETLNFPNSGYVVSEVPTGLSCRQLIGNIAMLAGGNAEILPLETQITTLKRNVIHIATYNFEIFENIFDGGSLKDYTKPQILEGGDFTFINTGNVISGGDFAELNQFHTFASNISSNFSTDDIVITGIQTIIDENKYVCGTDDYALEISNDLIAGDPQTAVDAIGYLLINSRFRTFDLSHTAYPIIDFADPCLLSDRKGNLYTSVVTDITFAFKGATDMKCVADAPLNANSLYSSQAIKAVQLARRDADKKLSKYDIAVQNMNTLAMNAMGYFESFEDDPITGGRISYLHDKENLSDSTIIYKKSADGFFLSQDGGATYTSGFDSKGNAVLNILSAIGINAEWIEAGTIEALIKLVSPLIVSDNSANPAFQLDRNGKITSRGSHGIATLEDGWLYMTQAGASGSAGSALMLSGDAQGGHTTLLGSYYSHFECVPAGIYAETLTYNIIRAGIAMQSDRRLKQDVKALDIETSKNIVKDLKPCEFRYKNNPKDKVFGLIAQETEEAFKNNGYKEDDLSITKMGVDGMYALNYVELIPHLINCINDLQKQVDELKEQIKGDK